MKVEVGTIYMDPEGEWEVTEINGQNVTVVNIQEDNLQKGQECIVSLEEVEYFVGIKPEDW